MAVTRAASEFAATIAREIAASGERVVGLDARTGVAGDVEWRLTDIATPAVVDALQDVDVVVHAAYEADLGGALEEGPEARRTRLVREVQSLSTAAAAAGVSHLVVISSAMVYGARPENPVPLPEDSPRRADDAEGLVADLLEVESILDTARQVHPGLRITSVRPAALVGPGVDTIITRHFEAPRLLALRGGNPAWQFCHVEDLARAIVTVLHESLPPVVAVGALDTLTQAEVEEIAGMRRVELSAAAAQGAADRLHRLGVLPLPATDLAYVSQPWAVAPTSLSRVGWFAAYDNATALSVLLEGVRGHRAVMARRLQRRDAALGAGAASAAVAAVATAALMRRRRRRG
ncbi:NAD-dependent epimerase/dehydratase family protein [Ornithinicoccus halotolerans]|uniref:NAD-dependent epimerase/dehydratase family protein n=1 Tax=Ornithinicoccus halotolerans TaxID=1748220 RepID=UPI001E299B1F|nr:NAD-dependent epimerase/dehydratase family protein [Ornithinicoccus halotolerans]